MNSYNTNNLFPVFLKAENLRVLIIGGGNVALEKLNALKSNSPASKIRLVATAINDEIKSIAHGRPDITLFERPFTSSDLDHADIVIAAVNHLETSKQITHHARQSGKLINVADKPELCDFYLGAIVKKGNLKIAISTNGKSPTIARRLKEVFADTLPNEMDELLDNMHIVRNRLDGDFTVKVKKLNAITKELVESNETESKAEAGKQWRDIATWSLIAFLLMIAGHLILSYLPLENLLVEVRDLPTYIDKDFYWMLATGFIAQLVDGALGMGYGVTCTTALLALGINLPAISGSIHTAEMFSSGISGYSHYKFGNVNKKLFKALLIPGIIGAVTGAMLLSKFGNEYAKYIRPVLACYTLFLGIKIMLSVYKKPKRSKVKSVRWLAVAGGFLDSFGGGGWGPLVTSTLVSKGRTPKYVIGSVSISEFFVTLFSAITFFSLIGISHWQIIVGLIVGGAIGAPIAAKLAGKLPLKTMFIAVGAMVIIWSFKILLSTFGIF